MAVNKMKEAGRSAQPGALLQSVPAPSTRYRAHLIVKCSTPNLWAKCHSPETTCLGKQAALAAPALGRTPTVGATTMLDIMLATL